jgi:hypothetical protein
MSIPAADPRAIALTIRRLPNGHWAATRTIRCSSSSLGFALGSVLALAMAVGIDL